MSKLKQFIRIADEKAHSLVSPMRKNNDEKLTDVSIEEAAVLAATYCKSVQDGQKIDVDYTFVKYIKKIPGGKPGMVTYTDFKTAYVAADKKLCEKLRIKK